MKYIMFPLLITILFLFSCVEKMDPPKSKKSMEQEMKITTYYLIRHAEKDRSNPKNQNPALAPEGQERVKRWASILEAIDFDAVYSTNFDRTRQTAAPVVAHKNLELQLYNPDSLYTKDFMEKTLGKTILIVGHSNTNPKLVNTIIGDEKYQDMEDSDNGRLYIVTLAGEEKKVDVLLLE